MARHQLWAYRFSIAYGWQWYPQRGCTPETGKQWLAVFQKDEPDIAFKVAINQPRVPPKTVKVKA
jgi:hypothetical protein